MSGVLHDPLLAKLAAEHGFVTRNASPPPALLRPKQVHGKRVVDAAELQPGLPPPEADAIVCADPSRCVAVVTADCVPILLASPCGEVVAAVHAGWRGLAAGVVAAGVAALCQRAACAPSGCVAAIGPHIGPCCYEVDEPVLSALGEAHGEAARAAARVTRPGHAQLDLGALSRDTLLGAGLGASAIGVNAVACTACDARRFHSFRRDGPRSGRLVHYIRPAAQG